MTSALLLAYVDRVGGAEAVAEVLRRCELADCEPELRDENCWFSWETKIALFEATAEVLGKRDFLEEMASFALDLNAGGGLKVALRTLGSPQFVYRSVVRANARFNGSHAMELVSSGKRDARIRFVEIAGNGRFHPMDCQYSAAMLRIVPELFGLPKAHLRHVACAGNGDEACVYDVHWREHIAVGRRAMAAGALGLGALSGSLALAPAVLPGAIAVAVGSTGALALAELRRHRQSWDALQREADDSAEVAQRLFESLQDLVCDLRLEEVLRKVTHNAQVAVGGREFVLLVRDGERFACQTSSGLPAGALAALETWSNSEERIAEQCVVLDDVTTEPTLTPLVDKAMPLCSLASAPLTFFGESLGLLVALGTQAHTFLPRDVEVLQSFASQASIALHNARRYQATKTQADGDALTGLLNHRSFHEALDAALQDRRRGCLVLIDFDNFKQVNDEDGHAAGDRLLVLAAAAMRDICRGDDLVFRLGGDEFALLLDGLDETAGAVVADRACAAIAAIDPRVSASAGVARLDGAAGKSATLERADRLLYAAKRGEHVPERAGAASSSGAARVAVEVLISTLELHHGPGPDHAVATLAAATAARLGLSPAECELVRQAGLLHDLGMLALPPGIVSAPGPLGAEALELVQTHPVRGAELVRRTPGLEPLAAALAATHERWDGTGYPAGLEEEQIPMAARVVFACAAYHAMISERPHRPACSHGTALAELRRCAGTQFDPAVVAALTAELSAAPDLRAA